MNPDDPRTGSIISSTWEEVQERPHIVLLGFPYDEGVSRNGGRTGAAAGPKTARTFIPKLGTVINPELGIDCNKVKVSDAGDIGAYPSLEDAHEKLSWVVQTIIDTQSVPFVIGGGNDQSYPNALGLLHSSSSQRVAVVNIDAHLDVRPLKGGQVHSGSPFYSLLNSPLWKQKGAGFLEFASQGNQCSKIHADYVLDSGNKICWFSEIVRARNTEKRDFSLPYGSNGVIGLLLDHLTNFSATDIFISFDIDSIQGSDCPGVSCPATVGLTAQEALDICFWAGTRSDVKLVDLSEYNPEAESYRTGRLVANMFYYFILGKAKSQENSQ